MILFYNGINNYMYRKYVACDHGVLIMCNKCSTLQCVLYLQSLFSCQFCWFSVNKYRVMSNMEDPFYIILFFFL